MGVICRAACARFYPIPVKPFELVFETDVVRSDETQSCIVNLEILLVGVHGKTPAARDGLAVDNAILNHNGRRFLVEPDGLGSITPMPPCVRNHSLPSLALNPAG